MGMRIQCDKLGQSLAQFNELRRQMETEAANMGIQLDEFQEAAAGMFNTMTELQSEQEIILLERIAADVEFRDAEIGLSYTEWEIFCSRVPQKYRKELEDQEGV